MFGHVVKKSCQLPKAYCFLPLDCLPEPRASKVFLLAAAVSTIEVEPVGGPQVTVLNGQASKPWRPMRYNSIDSLWDTSVVPLKTILFWPIPKSMATTARSTSGCISFELATIPETNLVSALVEEAYPTASVVVQCKQCTNSY